MERLDKRKIIGTIIGGLAFLSCILFFTYAWYNWRSPDTNVILGLKEVSIEFIKGPDVNVNNIGPVLDYHDGVIAEFKAINNNSGVATFNVSLDISSITDTLLVESFKYKLIRDVNGGTNYTEEVLEGNFKDFHIGNNVISSNVTLGANSTYSFQFIVYIDGNMLNNNNMQNNSMESTLIISESLRLNQVPSGSYVVYTGNNGCEGSSCSGQNANYVDDTDMGYCYNSSYKFNVNGWRVGYVKDGTAYLASAGSPECVRTYVENKSSAVGTIDYLDISYYYGSGYKFNASTGEYTLTGVTASTIAWSTNYESIIANTPYTCRSTSSTGTCSTMCELTEYSSTSQGKGYNYYNFERNGVPNHIAHLNEVALKYCNQDFAYGGVCDATSTWNMNTTDFQNIMGKTLSSCIGSSGDRTCGYGNDLIDNGGYYWFATPTSSSSTNAFSWDPFYRRVSGNHSYYLLGARVVLRLAPSVIVTGGTGTYEDPYQIVNVTDSQDSTYTVTYDYATNGGTSATVTSTDVDNGAAIDLTPTATKSGYKFVGWNTNEDATTVLSSSTMETSDITLYAIFKKTLTATFTVQDSNAATTSLTSVSCDAWNKATSCGITAPTLTAESEYAALGWNTSASATTSSLASGEELTINANETYYSITKDNTVLVGTFYYYNSGVKNTTASCYKYNGASSCNITVPLSTFNTTTAQFGGTYVGYGAVNTMGTSTETSIALTTNTSYYVSYRKNVTEYYQGTSRTIYRNAFFTSSTAMNTVLSTSTTGTSNLSTESYTDTNSIAWDWYSYGTSSSTTNRTYTTVSAAAMSTTTTLYTQYQRSATVTFYYYSGTAQATTTASGTQMASYAGTVLSNGTIAIPNAVKSSTGPNGLAYQGVSTSASSTTITTTITVANTEYYAVYSGNLTATFTKGENVSAIGSSGLSCTSNGITNGTAYSSTSCSITLPTITPVSGNIALGWYNSSGTKVGDAGDSLTLTSSGSYTAKAKQLTASDFSYDNTETGVGCDDVQCMIDKLDVLGLKLGAYVSLIPTKPSYTTDTSMTGYTSTQTINPKELNLWRVISLNADGTVDVISEHVSSVNIYFRGQTGYQNFIGYLNVLASQYENSAYTTGSRYFGYNGQTEYITDTSKFTNPAPWECETGGSCNSVESQGGGDTLYETDYNLVNTVLGTRVATNPSGTATAYWMASRFYNYDSPVYYYWASRTVNTDGSNAYSGNNNLYAYFGTSAFTTDSRNYALRPILTLRSGIRYSGDGTESSPLRPIG